MNRDLAEKCADALAKKLVYSVHGWQSRSSEFMVSMCNKWSDVCLAAIESYAEQSEAQQSKLYEALSKARVMYSRDHGMPNPSEPFPTHVKFSLEDWKVVADLLPSPPKERTPGEAERILEEQREAKEAGK